MSALLDAAQNLTKEYPDGANETLRAAAKTLLLLHETARSTIIASKSVNSSETCAAMLDMCFSSFVQKVAILFFSV